MSGPGGQVTIFLGGDVMTGRGVDQILAHPGDPRLWEGGGHDAATYVQLAESVNGPIARPVADGWPWGDVLDLLDRHDVQVRFANLETSITARGEPAPGKAVHYRMSPRNIGCLSVAGLDAVTLANNHVLDFGETGLLDTLDALDHAGIAVTGAGRDAVDAAAPAVVEQRPGHRVLFFGVGSPSSGIPPQWTATPDRPGVCLVGERDAGTVRSILDRVHAVAQPGRDIVVVSVHWGSNWGYDVPAAQVEFAHRLVDGGVDIVHGHSSHHPRPVEPYRGRLILYGCGDLIDDYEGITGYEEFRDDLRLVPLVTVERATGALVALRLAPVQARQLRLHRADAADTQWLRRTLDRINCAPPVVVSGDGLLEIVPA